MNVYVISAVVAVAVILIAADYLLHRRHRKTLDPQCSPEQAWEHYRKDPTKWLGRGPATGERLGHDPGEAIARACRDSAGETLQAPGPQVALRRAIMDATDRFVLADILRHAESSERGEARTRSENDYIEGVVLAGYLRCFAMHRFGDFDEDDWYAHYLRVADMNSKNVANMVRKTVRGEQASLETSLHDPLIRTMRQTRERLLHYPPRTPVKRATKLTGPHPTERAPTQKQIDRVTDIMSERFEKLFSGQIYHVENGPPVDPTGAFQIDAGLLYTILSIRFREPTDAWRQIMGKALGPCQDAMRDEDDLLDKSRRLHRVWIEAPQDGPLSTVMRSACRMVFGAEDLAAHMIEDAALLVGTVRTAVEES